MLIKHNGKYYRDKIEITVEQYNEIMRMFRNRPTAPEGHGYRLTEDLQWELYELPTEDEDPELTDSEALDLIVNGGGADA